MNELERTPEAVAVSGRAGGTRWQISMGSAMSPGFPETNLEEGGVEV